MRDFEVNQQIYISLQNKSQELAILKASTVGNVRVLDSAEVYPKPTSPKKSLINIIGFMLGAILSILFVLIQSLVKRGISSVDEFHAVGLNTYATIPTSYVQLESDRKSAVKNKASRHTPDDQLLLAKSHPADLSVEAVRSLRTSLHFSIMEAQNNIILISSGNAGVGKSFIASNLAVVLAQSEQKVLLIDADLRRGHLHKRLSMAPGAGISDYLCGTHTNKDIVKNTSIDNLDFISRGSILPNPSELLMTQKFNNFLNTVSGKYDVVIIDTPPILAVTDASIVGRYAGTIMLVARYEVSTIREVHAAVDRFEINQIEVKGLIFNAIDVKAKAYYGGYNYDNYSYASDSSSD
jgi:tyrosine-protein kinase Etk/Wzc